MLRRCVSVFVLRIRCTVDCVGASPSGDGATKGPLHIYAKLDNLCMENILGG